MKLDNSILRDIKDATVKLIISTTKSRYETHDEYITKCWLKSTQDVLASRGYELCVASGRGTESLEIEWKY